MKVGFVGVGNMGGPMCRNIIKNSGHEILVCDRDEAAVGRCVAVGGTGVGSIAEAVAESDVVFTSLPMPKDVEAVALGEGGIGESARQGTVHIDLSTNSPTMVRSIADRLAPRGVKMLDAPVSGGTTGAENATIAIMVGGDRAVFDEHRPLFESFGKNVIYAGALGAGSIAKIVNNMVAFCNMASGAEGLMLGAAAGIDPDVLNQVIRSSSRRRLRFSVGRPQGAPGRLEPDLRPRPRLQGPAPRPRARGRDRHSAAPRGPDPQPHADGAGLGLRRRRHDGHDAGLRGHPGAGSARQAPRGIACPERTVLPDRS